MFPPLIGRSKLRELSKHLYPRSNRAVHRLERSAPPSLTSRRLGRAGLQPLFATRIHLLEGVVFSSEEALGSPAMMAAGPGVDDYLLPVEHRLCLDHLLNRRTTRSQSFGPGSSRARVRPLRDA